MIKRFFLACLTILSVFICCAFFFSHIESRIKPVTTTQTLNNSDYMLLARIISAESRGEPYEGQVAVGAVILNRIEHPSFPDTMSGVIYQPLAFSCVHPQDKLQPVRNRRLKVLILQGGRLLVKRLEWRT